MSLAQGITLKPIKGSELIAAASQQKQAVLTTGKYLPPALRKAAEAAAAAAAAEAAKFYDVSDVKHFPTLGSVPVAKESKVQEPVFKKLIERRVQQDREEEMLGKRAKNTDIYTMSREQLEEIGFEVLRLPKLADPVKRLAFAENLVKHRQELDERYAKFQEGVHSIVEYDEFAFSTPLVPEEVVAEYSPTIAVKPVWNLPKARPALIESEDEEDIQYVEYNAPYDE